MKLRDRLLVAFASVILVAGVGLGLGVIAMGQLQRVSSDITGENIAALEVSADIRTLVGAQQAMLSRHLVANGREGLDDVLPMMAPFIDEANRLLARLRNAARSEEEMLAVASSEQALAALAELTLAHARGEHSDPGTAVAEFMAALDELRAAARLPYLGHFAQLKERAERVETEIGRLTQALLLVAVAVTVVGLLAALRLARRLSAPMESLAAATSAVAGGDYQVRVPASGTVEFDRVGEGFNRMAESLGRFHAMRLDQILAERHRLDTVIDSIDHGLLIIDDRGRIERINPVAVRQLGDPDTATPGAEAAALFAGSRVADCIALLLGDPSRDPLDGEDGRDLQREVDGSHRSFSWSLTPFSDARRRGLLLMLRDVSEERAMERMRTEFVLRAAHELRTPATGMRMSVGLLLERLRGRGDEREIELLRTLEEEMDRMVRLIAQLLDLARLYSRELPLERERIAPDDLLQAACRRHEAAAAAAGLGFDCSLDPDLPEVELDRSRIERVLDNLLTNAIRHTPSGGRVGLRASRRGDRLRVEVLDTGCGIPESLRDHVFEPFVQAGHRDGGAGLGLAISREIAEQHDGRLRLEHAGPEGCRFVLTLPLAPVQPAMPADA